MIRIAVDAELGIYKIDPDETRGDEVELEVFLDRRYDLDDDESMSTWVDEGFLGVIAE